MCKDVVEVKKKQTNCLICKCRKTGYFHDNQGQGQSEDFTF